MFTINAAIALIVPATILVLQAQFTLTNASPDSSWASRLVLEDPGSYTIHDIWSGFQRDLLVERQRIDNKINRLQLDEAIQDAEDLIKRVRSKLGNNFKMLYFLQTVYMRKMKAQAMKGLNLEALLEAARFGSFCADLKQGCYHTEPIDKIRRQIEDRLTNAKDPAEVVTFLGVGAEELADENKLEDHMRNTLNALHPRQNIWMNLHHRKYTKIWHDWALENYSQLLFWVQQQNSKRQQQPQEQPQQPRAPPKETAQEDAQEDSQEDAAEPMDIDSDSEASSMPTVDSKLLDKRRAIELSLHKNQLDESIKLARELLKTLEAETDKEPLMASFKQSVLVLKIEALKKARQHLEALVDCARSISYCTKVPNGGCQQADQVNKLKREIEHHRALHPYDFLGLDENNPTDMGRLKRARNKARLLLHPDKNAFLVEDQERYLSNLHIWAEEIYAMPSRRYFR